MGQSARKKIGTKRQQRDTRSRVRFSFCLDLRKSFDREVAQTIVELKSMRLFKRSVIDGLALVVSLRNGDLLFLDRMFPQVRAQIRREERDLIRDELASEQFNDLMREISGLRVRSEQQQVYAFSRDPVALEVATRQSNDLIIVTDEEETQKVSAGEVATNILGSFGGFFD